ncbi:MAG: class I SAM-dependent methyltransferase [Chloroflexi bacterium]|nr:class I SAM-dependent methyltransferase [Chloroflexota bacterium]
MAEQKSETMSNTVYRLMALALACTYLFMNARKQLLKSGVKEGQTVLDYGCGPGFYALPAAGIVGDKGSVYALDIHPLAIKSVRRKANKKGITNISTILSDKDTGLPDRSVDVALVYDAIHMIKDREPLIRELHRVTKPKGILSITAEHIKAEDVIKIAEKDNLFSLRERQRKLLNFERK